MRFWGKFSEFYPVSKFSTHIPVYQQMIGLLRNALNLLDGQGREEVFQYISSQQNPDGGFQDRGGRSDLYYSLFGAMMLKAGSPLNPPKGDFEVQTDAMISFRKFIESKNVHPTPGFIEKCCLILLQKECNIKRFSRIRTLFALGKSFWKERHSINFSYRGFVLFLTIDAIFPFPGILKFGAGKMLKRTTFEPDPPCSEVAAKVFLQNMLNREGSKEQELLKSFAAESGGFKAFSQSPHADMLSTAVALFALNSSGSDLRLFKPACLDFIQDNFVEGAFLSGDGDLTKDLEYTFYGLLALGVLAD